MKKKFLYISILITVMMGGCQKDLLTPDSETQVSTLDLAQFSTVARIDGQVRGLYTGLRAADFYGGRYIVYNELRADNYVAQSSNSVTATQTYAYTLGNGAQEVNGFWASAYNTINRCNLFIEGMAAKGNAVIGDATGKNYIAEAKMIRAICYYSLLTLYARPYYDGNGSKPGLPLRLTGNSVSGNFDLARSTVAEVYTQVLKDLNEAEIDLPANYSTALNNTIRAHKNTAIAYKTRVYLTMQRYADVVTEANKIVPLVAPFTATSGVAHALQADITNVFKTPYTTTESILSMPFVSGTENAAGQSALGSYFFGVVLYSMNPTGIIADAGWKSTDKRRSFIGSRSGFTVLSKYPTLAASNYADYVPIIRYAEVLLNLGEALARSTTSVNPRAVALLNAVRNRSDATTTFLVTGFAAPQALYDAFLKERNIELLGEGFRSPDLLRLGLTIPGKESIPAVLPSSPLYIWPIPSSELLYNKLMTDNL
ncbi:RagB/SusD family nutrient uptake outer membrane protein [Pedobacter cryophilus]|uniref:RagB/SusD family nutrient uptake outer membrane protein n=1 Tax=Pedobacter cryophilus TaxID=2571271 RepID=A0A4U1C7P9_9SPHI|nr:RagB/SusD family nutrient uptake outer membrane protein [Pedobacter cryophilus]TKC00437.1 RagB/SusD family nutrient uptake outer membrane protein [Pedobacter cryophilus]